MQFGTSLASATFSIERERTRIGMIICLERPMQAAGKPCSGSLLNYHYISYNSCSPSFSASCITSSGHREHCTSPMCALRRKNIQIRD